MLEDPILEELHKIREEWAAQFNYDIHAMVADLRQRQEAENRIVVTLPPKRVPVPDADVFVEADAPLPPLTFPPLQAQDQPLLETVIEKRR
ncbi:MAG: hypothetical protein HYR56_17395 [Acidobacteria bacterium]|nr:hypothetical protein [Acidobacteriota bacterium]MBI3421850.1 hypothetical protein [Acidobacteriota bacterium]